MRLETFSKLWVGIVYYLSTKQNMKSARCTSGRPEQPFSQCSVSVRSPCALRLFLSYGLRKLCSLRYKNEDGTVSQLTLSLNFVGEERLRSVYFS